MKKHLKGQGTFIKVVSLAIGLTVGLVLIAKVHLEMNYDRCIADKERVYNLSEQFKKKGEDANEFSKTPGGAIPALCRYIPEIEVGTRWTYQFEDDKLLLEDGSRWTFGTAILADSCFFDIFSTHIQQGDAKAILATKGQCFISRRLNERLGGNMVGKSFCYLAYPNHPMTVAGVFDDYEENSTFYQLDIVMSLSSIGLYAFDGTSQLVGNDRYRSYVRLRPGTDLNMVEEKMDKMLKELIPWDDLHAAGVEDYRFKFNPVSGSRMKDETVRTTCIILSIVAFVMLFTAVMNYILVVVSTMVGRARLVAIRKVLGAPRHEFYLTTMKEAASLLVLALLIMGLSLVAGQDWFGDLIGVSVTTLFSAQTCLVLAAVCLIVFVCCGLLPGYIYSRIPMVYAYRLFSENKRVWKLSLLAFQFVLSTMLLCLLSTIYRQYDYMLNRDLGYPYKDVAYIEMPQQTDTTFTLAREIEKLPCVKSATTAYSLFLQHQSGNNVMLPGKPEMLFNFGCLYFMEPSIVETMGLKVVQGKLPERLEHPGWTTEVIVDERFAERLKAHTGWESVVGQRIVSTEWGDEIVFTIAAVVSNFTLGTLTDIDDRPAMMFCGNIHAKYILVRLHHLTPESLADVQRLCDRRFPDAELQVKRYSDELADSYRETKHTRDLIMIGCLASLLITLIGLIGYVRDEVQRRSRELAIRKVMGSTAGQLQALFLRSIAFIALPSVIIGVALGWYFSTLLMEQFAEKAPLLWYVFALDAVIVLLVIGMVVLLQTRRVANNNPVDYLKTE